MPAEAIPFWNELVEMAPPGVLKHADRWAVEICATLMEKFTRQKSAATLLELIRESEMEAKEAKELVMRETISSSELNTLRGLLGQLGLTPADRSKVIVPVETPKNKFQKFA